MYCTFADKLCPMKQQEAVQSVYVARSESGPREQILDENAIEKLLVADWASGLRLTTVPQAMRRLSLTDELDFRSRTAVRLYGLW